MKQESVRPFETIVDETLLKPKTHRCWDVNPGDFIWLKSEALVEDELPLRVSHFNEAGTACWVESEEQWIPVEAIQQVQSSTPWLKLLADQWLFSAILKWRSDIETMSERVIQISPRELKILDGYQRSMIRWFLMQHREVERVWFETLESQACLKVVFQPR